MHADQPHHNSCYPGICMIRPAWHRTKSSRGGGVKGAPDPAASLPLWKSAQSQMFAIRVSDVPGFRGCRADRSWSRNACKVASHAIECGHRDCASLAHLQKDGDEEYYVFCSGHIL